jgi:uncharacterized membrane protein
VLIEETENWFSRAKAVADEGVPRGERIFGIGLFIFSILMLLYFVAHQTGSTGFYTSKFDVVEMVMLYGFWVFMITTSGLEGVLGLRLLSRIFDTFGGGVFATIGLAWLLVVFPFEFAHFSDVLPESIRFLFQWISNDVARVIMALGVILLAGALIYMPVAYSFVDIRRFKGKDITEPEMAPNTADCESDQEEES